MNQEHPPQTGVMDWLKVADRYLDFLLQAIIALIMLALGVMVFAIVIMRYGFSYSIFGMHEMLPILFAHATAVGAALAVSHREHICIPFIFDLIPERWTRYVDILNFVLLAIINAAIFWQSITWLKKTGFFPMPSLQIAQIWAKSCIPVATGFSILFCLVRILLVVFGDEKPTWFSAKKS